MTKIVFSLSAHEELDCLYDLINNIKKAFIHYDILILIGINNFLNIKFDKNKYEFVKIISIIDDNIKVWGNIELFNKHILNMEYLINNQINYDYFYMVSSNEMFIKLVDKHFIDNNCLQIIDKKIIEDINYETYFNNLLSSHHDWHWINLLIKDNNFTNYLYKNKYIIYPSQHEGQVIPSFLINEIYNEYINNKIYENSTYKDYNIEEIFISTYIFNNYNIKNYNLFCYRYTYSLKDFSYKSIINNLNSFHLSIKPVIRKNDNELRNIIKILL